MDNINIERTVTVEEVIKYIYKEMIEEQLKFKSFKTEKSRSTYYRKQKERRNLIETLCEYNDKITKGR